MPRTIANWWRLGLAVSFDMFVISFRLFSLMSNLMIGFSIDEIQAEYVAEIKLRHLNREYILNRISETDALEKEIAELEDTLESNRKIKSIIISELKDVIKKYGEPSKTQFFYKSDIEEVSAEEDIPDYACHLFLSESGYFKKIKVFFRRYHSIYSFHITALLLFNRIQRTTEQIFSTHLSAM